MRVVCRRSTNSLTCVVNDSIHPIVPVSVDVSVDVYVYVYVDG